jgi:hypothetical protein|tara:strand:+ start:7844 stop:8023 length:180 start_codon:yes stop_codon:yes gene_type:complete
MDGNSMNKNVSNLNHISEERWKKLLEYYKNNSLSLEERCSHLNEITHPKDMSREQSYKD